MLKMIDKRKGVFIIVRINEKKAIISVTAVYGNDFLYIQQLKKIKQKI